jgi:hypothetical protein
MRNSMYRSVKAGILGLGALASLSQAAWVHFDPADTSKVPKLFSQTGFYSNMAAKTVTSEAAYFDVNTPLWSDAAAKKRWILLKPGSTKVQFDPEEDYFAYPDGAVLVKLFMHDTVPGDTTTRIYWETRLLIKKTNYDTITTEPLEVVASDRWYPFSYKWKRDGSEAYLVNQRKGLDTTLTLTVNGQKRIRKWTFPSVAACNSCHREYVGGTQGRSVLGFFTPQLNRPSSSNPSLNQVRELFDKGILGWSKAAPTEAELGAMAKWARLEDETKSLDLRARSYIASNCSGCHGERGKMTGAIGHVELDYDFFKKSGDAMVPAMELRHAGTGFWDIEPIVNEKGDTLVPQLVVPGYPQLSTLLVRMKARNESVPTGDPEDTAFTSTMAQMPPLGVYEVDTAAIRVLTDWIRTMPPLPASIRRTFAARPADAPLLRGDMLMLPEGVRGKVVLTGIDGRHHELIGSNGHSFRIPKGLPAGIYLLKVGAKTFKLAF